MEMLHLSISSLLFWPDNVHFPQRSSEVLISQSLICSVSSFCVQRQVQRRKWTGLTNQKQEVTGNTETLVSGRQFVDFFATWRKQIISVSRAPCQQRLLALIHTALYCTYLTFSTNREYCVWSLSAAVYEKSRLQDEPNPACWWYLLFVGFFNVSMATSMQHFTIDID